MIFIDDLVCQPCRAWAFSRYLIYSWVIIQMVVLINSWLCFSE